MNGIVHNLLTLVLPEHLQTLEQHFPYSDYNSSYLYCPIVHILVLLYSSFDNPEIPTSTESFPWYQLEPSNLVSAESRSFLRQN